MLFSEGGEYLLVGFVISIYLNGGVFFAKAAERLGYLFFIALCLGVNRNRNCGGGEVNRRRSKLARNG